MLNRLCEENIDVLLIIFAFVLNSDDPKDILRLLWISNNLRQIAIIALADRPAKWWDKDRRHILQKNIYQSHLTFDDWRHRIVFPHDIIERLQKKLILCPAYNCTVVATDPTERLTCGEHECGYPDCPIPTSDYDIGYVKISSCKFHRCKAITESGYRSCYSVMVVGSDLCEEHKCALCKERSIIPGGYCKSHMDENPRDMCKCGRKLTYWGGYECRWCETRCMTPGCDNPRENDYLVHYHEKFCYSCLNGL